MPAAFIITEYIRGELFVLVHSLMTRDEFKEEEGNEAMRFLIGFVEFVIKLSKKVKKELPEVHPF